MISAYMRHAGTLILCNCHEHAAAGRSILPSRAGTTDLCMFDGTPNYRWGSARFGTAAKVLSAPPTTAKTRGSLHS